MLRVSFVLALLLCLNGWCAAQISVNAELPKLPEFKPVNELLRIGYVELPETVSNQLK